MAFVADLLEAARLAGLAFWVEADQLVVRGPAEADQLARTLVEHALAILALLAATELQAIFPGPSGPPAAPCSKCGARIRLHRSAPHPGWMRLDCACGHLGYMRPAAYADWRLRQLRLATVPTRMVGLSLPPPPVTAA